MMRAMNKLRHSFAFGASALVLATAATPAFAQDADAKDDGANPEIVVTAQFREQRLQDTPLAISAVNAEMLEARSQTSVEQVAAQAPNVTLIPGHSHGRRVHRAVLRAHRHCSTRAAQGRLELLPRLQHVPLGGHPARNCQAG